MKSKRKRGNKIAGYEQQSPAQLKNTGVTANVLMWNRERILIAWREAPFRTQCHSTLSPIANNAAIQFLLRLSLLSSINIILGEHLPFSWTKLGYITI